MPRGVPEIGREEWFSQSSEKRRHLVERWLDEILGEGGDPRATHFVLQALFRKARKHLGVKKLPPEIKRDILKLLEKVD